jgi:uncharacterized membrane protein
MSVRIPIIVLAIAATAGLFFASFSTFDFVQHLDRQVHDIHCSFAPGLVEEESQSEGCQVTMMSPYSSQFRSAVWGGIPISLAAMSVFAFLLFRAFDLLGRTKEESPASADFLTIGTLIPVGASALMGYIAYTELHAACKMCIGIYASSFVLLVSAIFTRRSVLKAWVASGKARLPAGGIWTTGLAQLGVFVALPILAYLAIVPDYGKYIGTCGRLQDASDEYGVMVPMDKSGNGVATIEVFDPLCPACRAFEERLTAGKLDQRLARKAVLFPLDAECNWMVQKSLHPGACAVSEAILCADSEGAVEAKAVVDWAFAHQEEILEASKQDPTAAARMVESEFGALASCLGSAKVKQRLNKSLRWTVVNRLPVLTPQLYVDGVKLCDEDTDLGLDWALTRMLTEYENGTLINAGMLAEEKPDPQLPESKKQKRRKRKPKVEVEQPAPAPTPEPTPEPAPNDTAATPDEEPKPDEAKADEKAPAPKPDEPAPKEEKAEAKKEDAPAEGGTP